MTWYKIYNGVNGWGVYKVTDNGQCYQRSIQHQVPGSTSQYGYRVDLSAFCIYQHQQCNNDCDQDTYRSGAHIHYILKQHESGYQYTCVDTEHKAHRHPELYDPKTHYYFAGRDDETEKYRNDRTNKQHDIEWHVHAAIGVSYDCDYRNAVQDRIYIVQKSQRYRKRVKPAIIFIHSTRSKAPTSSLDWSERRRQQTPRASAPEIVDWGSLPATDGRRWNPPPIGAR